MSYKDKMAIWMKNHPNATLQEAFEAGWFLCSEEWCQGKRESMEKCIELMKQIIT